MVQSRRLELLTPTMSTWCSNQLSYDCGDFRLLEQVSIVNRNCLVFRSPHLSIDAFDIKSLFKLSRILLRTQKQSEEGELGMTNESIYNFEVKDIDGSVKRLEEFKGNFLLIVNTASKCGFTPQYEGLEKLYKNYNAQGFYVLGFPCNQFGAQEPGDENEIKNFCNLNYQVSFPMFAKVDVNGKNAHPLYQYLKKQSKGILGTEFIKWNFTKFLIGKNGEVLKRYAPTDTPELIAKELDELFG